MKKTLITDETSVEEALFEEVNSVLDLEKEFSDLIKIAESNDSKIENSIRMDELDNIGDEVIKAKKFLAEYAESGKQKSSKEQAYQHLTALPLIGGWARNKADEIQETNLKNSGVKEVLKEIFNSFELKKKRLIELTDIAEIMIGDLTIQRDKLTIFIGKLDSKMQVENTSASEKMMVIDISNQAMLQKERTVDMIENQLVFILEMMGTLYQKLSKTLPVIKNTLNNSLTIAGTVNSMRDAITMMNSLEDLSNDIQKSSTENIHSLIIESTRSLTNGINIEFYKDSAKRNEEYNKTLLSVRKEYFEKTVSTYDELKDIQLNQANMLENRVKSETALLESRFSDTGEK